MMLLGLSLLLPQSPPYLRNMLLSHRNEFGGLMLEEQLVLNKAHYRKEKVVYLLMWGKRQTLLPSAQIS